MSLAEEVQISSVGTAPTNEPDIGINYTNTCLLICPLTIRALGRVRIFYANASG